MKMKQVVLERNGGRQVAWIRADAAVAGYEVELKEDNNFWKVQMVFSTEIDMDELKKNEQNYKSHRKGSDV